MEESVVAGVAVDKGQSKITVVGVPDVPGTAAEIFTVVAKADVNVDMIVQNIAASKTHLSDISFTLPADEFKKAVDALEAAKAKIGFESLQLDEKIGKLSIVGSGMKTHSGVSATLFGALAKAGVNIEMISTSEIRISVVTDIAQVDEAARVVHSAFGLDGETQAVVYAGTGTINTSDDREKTYIDITDIEKQVALELKANMKKFKFNDSIIEKGEKNARIHFGASAQKVKSIFEKHGLIAEDYAILCYDEVLKIDLGHINALINKGVSLIHLNRHEEAIKYCDAVLAIDPQNLLAIFNKGIAFINQKRPYFSKTLLN
jgi:predicted amino acid-binding ACT domain protein